MFGQDEGDRPKPVDRDIDIARLRDMAAAYMRPKAFRPGQLIQKITAKDDHSPNNLFIVQEVVDDFTVNMDPNNLSTYGLRFDLRIGWFDIDGDLCIIPSDSRYYEETRDVD